MIGIIDYGAGNLFSVKNALDYLGLENHITDDPTELQKADGLILPGVGAFADAMGMLKKSGLIPTIQQEIERKPLLGICLGMQILFDKGLEFGETEGLGLIDGTVEPIAAPGLKIPHMGWNSLDFHGDCPLLKGVPEGSYVYFVHSFAAVTPQANIAASCGYGGDVTALVQRGNVFGAQFHPEKSGEAGLTMLENFGGLMA
ncbi:imidazole glycerol phosphate synthase subunit HisH [Candidatus Soleaferrea massiliensis]|uniref:imidazole glycerol phosphate synthase subunit HisH n=1 Tax=Candidatus Soleaferrea massiliensis TaxID=1470354 RepID=UPI00059167DB|nr:imidazole glycerol phosphate synthase subunit HisH [Candidatus Soleaferrea massiliensis]